jgi:hypothetical protein
MGTRAILAISSLFLSLPPHGIDHPARPELQGVNVARVLRLAGAARRLLTAGEARSVLRKMGSYCHVSMSFTYRQKVSTASY